MVPRVEGLEQEQRVKDIVDQSPLAARVRELQAALKALEARVAALEGP